MDRSEPAEPAPSPFQDILDRRTVNIAVGITMELSRCDARAALAHLLDRSASSGVALLEVAEQVLRGTVAGC
jgi:AmiR/NasT family two-component response regulator